MTITKTIKIPKAVDDLIREIDEDEISLVRLANAYKRFQSKGSTLPDFNKRTDLWKRLSIAVPEFGKKFDALNKSAEYMATSSKSLMARLYEGTKGIIQWAGTTVIKVIAIVPAVVYSAASMLYSAISTGWGAMMGAWDVAADIGAQRIKAKGLGTTIGGVRAFNQVSSAYLDNPDEFLANVSIAMNDPLSTQANALADLGVKFKTGDDTTLVAADTMDAIKVAIAQNRGEVPTFTSGRLEYAYSLGSVHDLQRISGMDKSIKPELIEKTDKYQLSDVLARQGQHFALTMQDGANTLNAIGKRYLAEMSPQLIQLSKWIKDFLADIINAPYVRTALKEVLTGVDYELKKLNKNLKHFGELVQIVWEEAKELVKRMAAVIVKYFSHYTATNTYSNEIMPLNWQEQHFINVSNKNGMYARARHYRNLMSRGGRYGEGASGASSGGGDVASAKGAAPVSTIAYAMRIAEDQLRREGVTEEHLRPAAALLMGQALRESDLKPDTVHDNGTGYGIYGAHLGRRDAMLEWLNTNGYAKNSLEGQIRYMAKEAMETKEYGITREALLTATPENILSNSWKVTDNFEHPYTINDRTLETSRAYKIGPSNPVLATGKYYAIGDSLAEGIKTAIKASGSPNVGAQPEQDYTKDGVFHQSVINQINALPDNELKGASIILSTGASNDPNDSNISGLIKRQIAGLIAKGADPSNITVIGVGTRQDYQQLHLNDTIKKAVEEAGVKFHPLDVTTYGGVHPDAEGYLKTAQEIMQVNAADDAPRKLKEDKPTNDNTPVDVMFPNTEEGVAAAKKYLSTLSENWGRKGDVTSLHPIFALRLARAMKMASDQGIKLKLSSTVRLWTQPGISDYDRRGNSLHAWGGAADVDPYTLGRDRSPTELRVRKIFLSQGLYNPYLGTGKEGDPNRDFASGDEYNHWQILPTPNMPDDTYQRLINPDKAGSAAWQILQPYRFDDKGKDNQTDNKKPNPVVPDNSDIPVIRNYTSLEVTFRKDTAGVGYHQ